MKWQCSATSGATNEPAVEGRDGGEDLEEQADSFVLMHYVQGKWRAFLFTNWKHNSQQQCSHHTRRY